MNDVRGGRRCSRKEKKGSCVNTIKTQTCHQFKRSVVWVVGIDPFKDAGLLLGILGR
jgi:hypothetical protein